MARKQTGQSSFADMFVGTGLGANARLEAIDEAFEWSAFEQVLDVIYDNTRGRPSYPPVLMFKVLLLQQWYDLSDPMAEEALGDRLSFRRFVGLSLSDGTPDHSTISRFRSQLDAHALGGVLFEELARQLDSHNLIVRKGTLMDASIISAQAAKPSYRQGSGASSPTDPDADWTRKGGKSHFGYKAHIATDQGSGLIRRAILTPANINESSVADDLVMGDEAAIYADKGYENKHRRRRLKEAGIKDRIMHRSHKHQDGLPYWQQQRNRLIIPIRSPVEQVFGLMKRSYGYTQVRYLSLKKNALQLDILCIAINIRKALVLMS